MAARLEAPRTKIFQIGFRGNLILIPKSSFARRFGLQHYLRTLFRSTKGHSLAVILSCQKVSRSENVARQALETLDIFVQTGQ